MRAELLRKPEEEQGETCIEKRCSALLSLSDRGGGLALLMEQKGAVNGFIFRKRVLFFFFSL